MGAQNIFAQYARPVRSVAEHMAEYDKRDLLQAQLAGAQRQNSIADLTMQQTRGSMADEAALRAALQGLPPGATNDARLAAMYGTGTPTGYSRGDAFQKAMDERLKTQAQIGKDNAATDKDRQGIEAGRFKMFTDGLTYAETPEQGRRWAASAYVDPVIGPFFAQMFGPEADAIGRIPTDPAAYDGWRRNAILGMPEVEKRNEAQRVADQTNTTAILGQNTTAATALAGRQSVAATALAGQQSAAETARRARVQADQHFNQKREDAANPQMKGPKVLTEQQIYKLRTDMGKDHATAIAMLSQMEDVIESSKAVRDAPGLDAATGYSGKYLPSFTGGKAAHADTRIANLRGKVTAMGKAAASLSGAIGPMAVQEWKILADQVAVLDEVKGKGPMLEQIALLEAQAEGAIDRIRERYENTRGEDFERFPQFAKLPARRARGNPAKPTADGLTEEELAELKLRRGKK